MSDERPKASDLLGIAPDWTGGLSTDQYLAEMRGGGIVTEQREAIERVRALHHEQPNEWWDDDFTETPTSGPTECAHCFHRWPCPTIAALDGPFPRQEKPE